MQAEGAATADPLRAAIAAWADWYQRMGVLDAVEDPELRAPQDEPAEPPQAAAAISLLFVPSQEPAYSIMNRQSGQSVAHLSAV